MNKLDKPKIVIPIPRVTAPTQKPKLKERDMRQEAVELGSHQAKEFFGSPNDQ